MRPLLLSLCIIVFSCFHVSAASIKATDSYYTFGSNVSANTTRLLADKAPVIGFPTLATVSFLLFDPADLPSTLLNPAKQRAYLSLRHDPDALAGTLIPATDARPVSVSTYAVAGTWDDVNGNLAGIDYGTDGDAAIDMQLIGDPGRYRWDITALVNSWIASGTSDTSLALSGVFGNVNIDDRNSYAAMYAVGAPGDRAPGIDINPIPLPASLPLLLAALLGLGGLARRRSTP